MIELDKIGKKAGMEDYFIPLISSFSLHILILLFIAFGWEASAAKNPEHKPQYIKAKLVQLDPPKPVTKSEEKKLAPPKPDPVVVDNEKKKAEELRKLAEKQQAEAQRKEAERKAAEARKAEEQRKAEAARKAEAEKKLAAEKKAEAEKKAAELARKKAEEEALAKKAAAEKALKEKQQQEALARKKAEEDLLLALAEEESYQQQQRDAEIAQDYASLIRQRVEQAWSRPPSARRGMEVLLEITLVPTGYIVNVAILKGSGNPAFDLSAEQAVRRVERFEELKDMPASVFESRFRRFQLLFRPEDKPS